MAPPRYTFLSFTRCMYCFTARNHHSGRLCISFCILSSLCYRFRSIPCYLFFNGFLLRSDFLCSGVCVSMSEERKKNTHTHQKMDESIDFTQHLAERSSYPSLSISLALPLTHSIFRKIYSNSLAMWKIVQDKWLERDKSPLKWEKFVNVIGMSTTATERNNE